MHSRLQCIKAGSMRKISSPFSAPRQALNGYSVEDRCR